LPVERSPGHGKGSPSQASQPGGIVQTELKFSYLTSFDLHFILVILKKGDLTPELLYRNIKILGENFIEFCGKSSFLVHQPSVGKNIRILFGKLRNILMFILLGMTSGWGDPLTEKAPQTL
jgi:hypothetical protein